MNHTTRFGPLEDTLERQQQGQKRGIWEAWVVIAIISSHVRQTKNESPGPMLDSSELNRGRERGCCRWLQARLQIECAGCFVDGEFAWDNISRGKEMAGMHALLSRRDDMVSPLE